METYLVYVNAASNSNKFWSAKVEESKITVQWGRVGYDPQIKVHQLSNQGIAIAKYNNLVVEKKAKGYEESQPQIESCSVVDIRRAIQLLDLLRSYIANRNLNTAGYIDLLNQYLKIIPTPLGMQLDPYRIFRSVADIDHQRQLLSSLLPATTVAAAVQVKKSVTTDEKVVSLRGIHPNLWRHF
ncbi:WGR domain-containing protein [Anabaena azotica]|uniref:WGR domain-containing protein n=1 Tax=Anabaena azotica FACHB-119 TaxID=947527 RepID=A0ABR8DGF6_9NOST|nr:WGR domain-containing protein [Anabaena azotica]MBD2505618.1 WGR domain-containing protein [Anabaena azotica FACHB-119]